MQNLSIQYPTKTFSNRSYIKASEPYIIYALILLNIYTRKPDRDKYIKIDRIKLDRLRPTIYVRRGVQQNGPLSPKISRQA